MPSLTTIFLLKILKMKLVYESHFNYVCRMQKL